MNPNVFISTLEENSIYLNKEQKEKFGKYFQMLVEWNEKVNLTAITDEKEVYLKHFYDSISASFYFDFKEDLHICDVGAGAGFPSIPLKICFPHLHITIVDSLQKRITFLERLVTELQLTNVSLFHSRAEDFGQTKEYRGNFDVVMARAVARMSVLSELCLPLVKKNGHFIAMKGSRVDKELNEANKAIRVLGGKIHSIETFTLPKENSERSIVIIEKQKSTPNRYPRKAGTPNKSPIS